MGLFVVGRLAARHGVRVRLRHAQAGGLTALIWLPDTVAAPEVAPPLGRLRRFEADDYGPAASLSAPTATAPPTAASQATAAARIPRFSPTAARRRSDGSDGSRRSRRARRSRAILHPCRQRRVAGLSGRSRHPGRRPPRPAAGRRGRRGRHPGRQQLGAGRQRLGPGQRPGRPGRAADSGAAGPQRQRGRAVERQRGRSRCRATDSGIRRPEQAARLRRDGAAAPAVADQRPERPRQRRTERGRHRQRDERRGTRGRGRRPGDGPASGPGAAAADLRLAGVRLVPAEREDPDHHPAGPGRAGRTAGRAGFVDVARRRRLARGPGSGVARGRRNNHGRAAEAGSEG